MEDKLVEFANLLRQNGVRVSLAETLDALAASGMVGLSERDAFRGALRATMIKRASELPVFEELFDVYFSGLGEIIKQAGQGVQDALSMSDQEFQKFLDQVEEMLKQQGDKLSELARELLQNRSGQLEKRLREAARAVRLQGVERTIEENYFARALARALGLDKLEQEIRELREQVQKLEYGNALKAQLEKYLDRRLKALEDIIRRYVRMEREKRDLRAREEQRLNQLSDKSFYYLSDEELDRMKEAVTRLAQRLKNVLAVRRKHAEEGPLRHQAHACARIWNTAACHSNCASRNAVARSRRWSSCATFRTRFATPRASCCSSFTRYRTFTRGCAASSSSPTSAKLPSIFVPTTSRKRSTSRSRAI